MSVNKLENPKAEHGFIGKWHIYEMEMWSEDYFNLETQAYIEIRPDNLGDFQFGLVSGYLDGDLEKAGGVERFSFIWEGQDEMDEVNGSGWLRLVSTDEIEEMINLHLGDRSMFKAKRV